MENEIKQNDAKIVAFQIIDGSTDDIRALGKALNDMKKRIGMNLEFVVTNDRIRPMDCKELIKELYRIHKGQKRFLTELKEENKKIQSETKK